MKLAMGVDIGGTNTKLGFIQEDGTALRTSKFPTNDPANFGEFLQRLSIEVKDLASEHFSEISGIGIGVPDYYRGMVQNAPNLSWGDIPFEKKVKDIFSDLLVHVSNDANAAAVGEKHWGIARDLENFAVITLGTGIGSGVFIKNQLFEDSEAGHMQIAFPGRRCGCGGQGHFESYASVRGIKITAKEITQKDWSFGELLEALHQGDSQAQEVFLQTANYLAQGLAAMGNFLCLDAFILTGGVSNAGDFLLENTEKKFQDYLFANHRNQIKLKISQLSTESGAIAGAAALIFEQLKG